MESELGRATHLKAEQIHYIQSRVTLLSQMAQSLNEDATGTDLQNVKQQLENLAVKVERFKKDWDQDSK